MPVSADALRTHLDYTAWASRRLLEAAARLSPEDLQRDFGTADRSVLGTLAHVYAADRVWLQRLTGVAAGAFITDADRSLEVLQRDWPPLQDRWKQWAGALGDEGAQAAITYRDLKNNQWTQPVWQVVLHVVNHGSHHRGQISGFLRSMGHMPPAIDLIQHYRELA